MSLPDLSHFPWFAPAAALFQIVVVDLTLAGDNAVAVGMAANGLPADRRRWAIGLGMGGAAVMLCAFALMATWLLSLVHLTLAGGLLLLWVCWRMWVDLRAGHAAVAHTAKAKTLKQALLQILVADLSMSLDNVLAIAGVARHQPHWVLVFGLLLSITLTAFAAAAISKVLRRAPWLGYVGLAIVAFVAFHMIWEGVLQEGVRL